MNPELVIPKVIQEFLLTILEDLGKGSFDITDKDGSVLSSAGSGSSAMKVKSRSEARASFTCNDIELELVLSVDDGVLPDGGATVVKTCARSLERQLKMLTELKNRERMNKFEEAIIEASHEGIIVLNPEGIITHANQKTTEVIGFSREELLGHHLSEFVESNLIVLDIFKTGRPIIEKEVFVKLKNRTLHILKTAVPVRDEKGNVIAVIDSVKEIKGVRNLVNRMVGASASFTFNDIIFKSGIMADTVEMAQAAAQSTLPVLIQGESGTGKELFAHAIHNSSDRRNGPFIIIDCAAIPRELVESELFGYADGAFTGARKGGRTGKFELANGGTVFIDEIGELPVEIQAKFLRVLQCQNISRVGDSQVLPLDIRIIAATNRNLDEEVAAGNFREDLYYRLNVLSLQVPSLRERSDEDIRLITDQLIIKYMHRLQRGSIKIAPETLGILSAYSWPGNVRELENAVARAAYLCGGVIEPGHLPAQIIRAVGYTGVSAATERDVPPRPEIPEPDAGPCFSADETEKNNILKALEYYRGNKVKTAEALGISRSTLYKKLGDYGIEPAG